MKTPPIIMPLMKHLLESGFLSPLDEYFGRMHEGASEHERAFFAAVMRAARAGHLCLDLSEMEGDAEWQQAVTEGAKTGKSPHIATEDGRAYLVQNYQCEIDIALHVQRLCGRAVMPEMETSLAAEQKAAFECVRRERFSIVTGGPGTGKTFLIGEIAKGFERVIMTAPTGKAASVLKEKNRQAICGTVHALFGAREEKFVQADLIVVDEASMLDVKMARR